MNIGFKRKATCFSFTLLLVLLVSFSVVAQGQTLSGKVTDLKGSALSGATVSLKDGSKSAVTNEGGGFTLENVPATGVVIVSFVGYGNKELKYNAGNELSVALEESSKDEEEVVVTGVFDKRKKLESSVAISTLNAKQISQLSPTSAADL